MVRARFAILSFLFLVASFAALLIWRSPERVQAQGGPEPICDVTCGPDPGGSGYSGTFAARAELPNARGVSSSIVPKHIGLPGGSHGPEPRPKPAIEPVVLPGSESYNRAMPILSLPGRNGLDLHLTLHYSSRVWTIDSVNNTVTFNADRDFPSYGFRLGFGYLEYDLNSDTYVLTEADGTKRRLVLSAAGYESDDNSFILYGSTTKILRYKNGTQVLYEPFPDAAFSSTHLRPKKITDTNGNFISVTYLTGTGRNQHINTITDTPSRLFSFEPPVNVLVDRFFHELEHLDAKRSQVPHEQINTFEHEAETSEKCGTPQVETQLSTVSGQIQ
jgi:hypothetical protein